MSFGNPSELFLLARICFLRLMLFSVSACLVFVASTERKIGLLPSMARHISVTTCDACAADHVVRFTSPSPSLVPRPRVPPGEKRSGEQSRISWAYYPKRVMTNEIARSVIITYHFPYNGKISLSAFEYPYLF